VSETQGPTNTTNIKTVSQKVVHSTTKTADILHLINYTFRLLSQPNYQYSPAYITYQA